MSAEKDKLIIATIAHILDFIRSEVGSEVGNLNIAHFENGSLNKKLLLFENGGNVSFRLGNLSTCNNLELPENLKSYLRTFADCLNAYWEDIIVFDEEFRIKSDEQKRFMLIDPNSGILIKLYDKDSYFIFESSFCVLKKS